jgi:hypothetical protein
MIITEVVDRQERQPQPHLLALQSKCSVPVRQNCRASVVLVHHAGAFDREAGFLIYNATVKMLPNFHAHWNAASDTEAEGQCHDV